MLNWIRKQTNASIRSHLGLINQNCRRKPGERQRRHSKDLNDRIGKFPFHSAARSDLLGFNYALMILRLRVNLHVNFKQKKTRKQNRRKFFLTVSLASRRFFDIRAEDGSTKKSAVSRPTTFFTCWMMVPHKTRSISLTAT